MSLGENIVHTIYRLCFITTIIGGYDCLTNNVILIPKTEVERQCVEPNDISIIVENFDKSDGKGIPETYLMVGNKRYEMIYDSTKIVKLLETEFTAPKHIQR